MITLNLYDMFNSNTLRSRSTANFIIECISKIPSSEKIEINFKNIVFASRSFCHELLIGIKNRKNVFIVNTNTQVEKMMEVALKKPEIDFDFTIKNQLLRV